MLRGLEKLQGRIMTLSIIGTVLKMAFTMAFTIMCLCHIEQYGLKHLIDTIWLGN